MEEASLNYSPLEASNFAIFVQKLLQDFHLMKVAIIFYPKDFFQKICSLLPDLLPEGVNLLIVNVEIFR